MDSALDDAPLGLRAVDEVLAQVGALSERTVADHVDVFESAHRELRRALDAQAPPAETA